MADELTPPTPAGRDRVYALVRGGVASIPVVGGVAGEVFSLVLAAPLEKRRNDWMEQVAQRLREVERTNANRFADLETDATFTSVLLQATQAAYRSHRDDKTELLQNAVHNSAMGVSIEADLQVAFVRFIDELAPAHAALLAHIRQHAKALAYVESWEALYGQVSGRLTPQPPREQFQLYCGDLRSRMLLRISDHLEDFKDLAEGPSVLTTEGEGGPMLRVTEIGVKFLDFISASSEPTTGNPRS